MTRLISARMSIHTTWPMGLSFLMVTVGFGLTGGIGKPRSLRSATCSSMPPRARDRQSSMECPVPVNPSMRSEEHTSELQSRLHLVCRLLLEKKKKKKQNKVSNMNTHDDVT